MHDIHTLLIKEEPTTLPRRGGVTLDTLNLL